MATNASTVIDNLEQQAAEARANAEDLQRYAFSMGQNAASAAALQEKTGMNIGGRYETPGSYMQRMQADLEAQAQRQSHAGAIDYTALSFELAGQIRDTTRTAMQQASRVQQDMSVSLFEDPAGAIINAFTLPWDQQELDGTKQSLEILHAAKSKLDTTVQQHAQSTEALKQSITADSLLSVSQALSAEQQIKVLGATNLALQTDASAISAVFKMKEEAVNALVKIIQVQNHEEAIKVSKENLAANRELREQRLKEMKEKEDAQIKGVEFINAGRRRDGLPPLDKTQAMFGLSQPKGSKIGEQYGNWLDRGIMAMSGLNASDGENTFERVAYRNSVGAVPKNTRQQTLMLADSTAAKKAFETNKDKAAASIAADNLVKIQRDAWEANIVPGDTSNPFQPPSYAILPEMGLDHMKAYPVLATLLTDANKNNPIDHQQVFDTMVAAVTKGEVKGNDAAALISQLYKKTLVTVNIQSDAEKLTGRKLENWNAKVNTGNVFTNGANKFTAAALLPIGNTVADLTDEVKVQHLLQKAIVTKLGASINWAGAYPDVPGGGGFYPPLLQSGVVAPTIRK